MLSLQTPVQAYSPDYSGFKNKEINKMFLSLKGCSATPTAQNNFQCRESSQKFKVLQSSNHLHVWSLSVRGLKTDNKFSRLAPQTRYFYSNSNINGLAVLHFTENAYSYSKIPHFKFHYSLSVQNYLFKSSRIAVAQFKFRYLLKMENHFNIFFSQNAL